MCEFSCGHSCFSLCTCLLNHRSLCLAWCCRDCPAVFQRGCIVLHAPQLWMLVLSLYFLPGIWCCQCLIVATLMGVRWHLILACNYLMVYDVEHLFIYLFSISLFWLIHLVRCLPRSFAHLNNEVNFLIVEFCQCLVYFGYQSVFDRCYLPACGLSFHSLNNGFCTGEF